MKSNLRKVRAVAGVISTFLLALGLGITTGTMVEEHKILLAFAHGIPALLLMYAMSIRVLSGNWPVRITINPGPKYV